MFIKLVSLLYTIRKRITDIGEPWGIPLSNGNECEILLATRHLIFLFFIKLITYLSMLCPMFHSWSCVIIACIPILSKALLKSSEIIEMCCLCDSDSVMRWSMQARLSKTDLLLLKPTWFLWISLFVVTNHHNLLAIILSSILATQGLRLIGLYEVIEVLSEFGLSIGITRLVLYCCGIWLWNMLLKCLSRRVFTANEALAIIG